MKTEVSINYKFGPTGQRIRSFPSFIFSFFSLLLFFPTIFPQFELLYYVYCNFVRKKKKKKRIRSRKTKNLFLEYTKCCIRANNTCEIIITREIRRPRDIFAVLRASKVDNSRLRSRGETGVVRSGWICDRGKIYIYILPRFRDSRVAFVLRVLSNPFYLSA